MRGQVFMLFVIAPFLLHAQTDNQTSKEVKGSSETIVSIAGNGIQWTNGLSWKEVLKKARQENKYIFLDLYTTWCGPCKLMDKEVYTASKVGEFFNKRFICARVQMDKTTKDGEEVKKWYSDADALDKKYGITAYPSYLFFSPDGSLIYRETGYKRVDDFIGVAQNSLNKSDYPYKRYYESVAAYKNGKKVYELMPALIDTAKRLNQADIADALEKDFRNYLSSLKESELYTNDKIIVIASLLKGSGDTLFYLFTKHSNQIDSAVGSKGYAYHIVDDIIQKDVIDAALKNNSKTVVYKPDWAGLEKTIANLYGVSYVERNILMGKMKWHEKHHEWGDTAKNLTLLNKNYGFKHNGSQADLILNSIIWNSIFKRSTDKEEVDAAIECMKNLIDRVNERKEPPFVYLDTYANLLYKAGRVSEAIDQEKLGWQKTVEWKQHESVTKEYLEIIEKMKQSQPTWPHYVDKDDIF